MAERKLASIQSIKAIEPIPGADAIERATVLGWQCVVKKGEFKPGDHVVYCEVDSLLPVKPEFERAASICVSMAFAFALSNFAVRFHRELRFLSLSFRRGGSGPKTEMTLRRPLASANTSQRSTPLLWEM